MAVFRVGGIDALLDIISAVITAVSVFVAPSDTVTFIVTGPVIGISVIYLQSLNHCLVYNVDIREKMFDCIRPKKKCSKVIILRRE